MSGDQERTQNATPKRLARARAEGDVARSAFAPVGLCLIFSVLPFGFARQFAAWWISALTRIAELAAAAATSADTMTPLAAALHVAIALQPMTMILAAWTAAVAASIGAAAVTGALGWSWGAAIPKIARLSLAAGFKSLISADSIARTGVALLAVTALVACAIPAARMDLTAASSSFPVRPQAEVVERSVGRFWKWAALALTAIAGLDILLARRTYAKRLRMTLQEVRDERAELEGKPEIKARRRAIGAKHARRLRVAAIKSAAAVIINPTHVAVALQYSPPAVDVPIVVSLGTGGAAAIVRSVANQHGVPIVRSPDLARALLARVDVDEAIPDELYVAVAAVFAWILRTRGKLGGVESP